MTVCRSVLLVLGMLLGAPQAFAMTVKAATCSQADVQTAVDATSTSFNRIDRVLVPAGSCTWSTSVVVSGSRRLWIQGAGTAQTIITVTAGINSLALFADTRVTDIKFLFPAGSGSFSGLFIKTEHFLVERMEFHGETGFRDGVSINGDRPGGLVHPQGVVANSVFYRTRTLVQGDQNLLAHEIWAEPLYLGKDGQGHRIVYIEDNTFELGTNSSDGNYGGRWVFRNNTVTQSYIEAHSLQGNHRATRSWEVYNNTFIANTDIFTALFYRGGTGVIYNNTLTGPFGVPIRFDNIRSNETWVTNPPGFCNGSSFWDGNITLGWPCRDQLGRGGDTALWDGTDPATPQLSEPVYLWSNTQNGSPAHPFVANCGSAIKPNGSCADVVSGRDYISTTSTPKPGYTAFTYPHPARRSYSFWHVEYRPTVATAVAVASRPPVVTRPNSE